MIMGSRAINRDLKVLFKQNVFETELPDDDNIFIIDLVIKCGGNWEGMTHKFRAKMPVNYPFSYPLITCLESERTLHPNIQPSDGSVCLGILSSEQWKAMFSLTDICSALSSMFLSPNWEHSLNQEAFQLFHDNKIEFDRRLRAIRNVPADMEVKTEVTILSGKSTEVKNTSETDAASPKKENQITSKRHAKKAGASNGISNGVTGIDINRDTTTSKGLSVETSSSSSHGEKKVAGISTSPTTDKEVCKECSPSSPSGSSRLKDNEKSADHELCIINETVAMVRQSSMI